MQQATWGTEEFGHTKLGDRRRTARLVRMADAVLANPGGTVTAAIGPGAARQGAYRRLESPHGDPESAAQARNIACARRMEAVGGVMVVAVDQTSIHLSDRTGERDFGSVGTRTSRARGVQAMVALALDPSASPLGVLGEVMFGRSDDPTPPRIPGHPNRKRAKDKRPPEERESIYWPELLSSATDVAVQHAPSATPWFQCDAGADFWGTFLFASETTALVTVRMNCTHVVRDDNGRWSMQEWLSYRPVRYHAKVRIPAHDGRRKRSARVHVRYGNAELRLPVPGGQQWVPMSFVEVYEPRPRDVSERIHWILATNFQVDTVEDAARVIDNYTYRWRVEDFFRAWKTGGCNIESSQLQSYDAFRLWSIITSSVTARAEYIKHASRQYPDAPATTIYSREEIDTMIAWRRKHAPKAEPTFNPGDTPSLSEMTRCVAQLGGYMKSRNSAPPGSVTLIRGLLKLEVLVEGRSLAQDDHRRGFG